MLFQDTWLKGRRVDVLVEGSELQRIAEANTLGDGDLRGGTLSPPFAEPHVHLDAALLGRRAPNVSGTLAEGIRNWAALRDDLTHEDVRQRAIETVRMYVGYGTTRIRTHVDTNNLAAVEALLALREELAQGVPGLSTKSGAPVPVTLQVVAFPQEGVLRRPLRRDYWEACVKHGVDAVGVIPHFERTAEEGWSSVLTAFSLADTHGVMIDLHCDETDDPGSRFLEAVCAEAIERGNGELVVAGHCCALAAYPNPHAAKVIDLVVESGVQVVVNPLDNIVLQGRYDGYPRRRGLTRVDQLWAAGAVVGIGHDSVMDPWYRLGTANMIDPVYMLVHAGHLTGEADMVRCFDTLSEANHRPFGGAPTVAEGERADLVWYDAHDPIEVIRLRPRPRVFVGGDEVT